MRLVCLYIVFNIGACLHAQTSVPAGNVSGTWTKSGSPYKVNGNIIIPSGQTLTIEPGVRIEFAQFKYLTVDGRILAQGGSKATDSIWFTKQNTHDSGSWKGVKFVKTSNTNDTSYFKYCVFRNCKSLYDTTWYQLSGGLTIGVYGKVKVANSSFYLNEAICGASIYVTRNAYAQIRSCLFKNNKASQFWIRYGSGYAAGSRVKGSAIAVDLNSRAIVDSCIFRNNIRGRDYEPSPSILYDASVVDVEGYPFKKLGAFLTVTNSVFDNNEGNTLVSYTNGNATVSNCSFVNAPKDNSLYLMYSYYLSVMNINNCSMTGNKSQSLLFAEGSKLNIANSIITSNENSISAKMQDPSLKDPTLNITSCKIFNNTGAIVKSDNTIGGGIEATTISNTLIANNNLAVVDATVINSSSIVFNRSSRMWIIGYGLTCRNSIIWGNHCDSFPGKQIFNYPNKTNSFYNCLIENDTAAFAWKKYSVAFTQPTVYQNNLSSDPLFNNPAAGYGASFNAAVADFSLKSTCASSSPAINKGMTDTTGLFLPSKDLNGNVRVYESRLDIGSYEDNSGSAMIKIIRQPVSDTLCQYTRNGNLSVSAIGKGINFQWQQSVNNGNTWTDINGATASFLTMPASPAQNNLLYRVILNGTCDKDTGNTAGIMTYNAPAFSLGKDTAVCNRENIAKTVNVPGTYLWHDGSKTNSLNRRILKDELWWLQVTTASGCVFRDSFQVSAKPLPAVSLGADRSLHKLKSITLDAGAGQSSYLWNDGSASQSRTFFGRDLGVAGTYWIWAEVTAANACKSRDSVQITVTDNSSVDQDAYAFAVKIYPQPVTDILTIEAQNICQVRLVNAWGQVLRTEAESCRSINMAEYAPGIYFLYIVSQDQQVITYKITKL